MSNLLSYILLLNYFYLLINRLGSIIFNNYYFILSYKNQYKKKNISKSEYYKKKEYK